MTRFSQTLFVHPPGICTKLSLPNMIVTQQQLKPGQSKHYPRITKHQMFNSSNTSQKNHDNCTIYQSLSFAETGCPCFFAMTDCRHHYCCVNWKNQTEYGNSMHGEIHHWPRITPAVFATDATNGATQLISLGSHLGTPHVLYVQTLVSQRHGWIALESTAESHKDRRSHQIRTQIRCCYCASQTESK